MSDFDDITQSIKGKLQVLKGKTQQATGDTAGGTWEEIKGKANQSAASVKQHLKKALRDT